jgi:hypothetical protein
MKSKKIILISALLLLFSCSSLRKSMIATGEDMKEVAINNAVLDFSKKCKLFNTDTVFYVDFKDSVFHKTILMKVDEGYEWKIGSFYGGIVSVGISSNGDYQFFYSEETKSKLPSRYKIINGKLFFWSDKNYPVTDKMIAILWKYNCLQTYCIIPEYSTNDSEKVAYYYFCKNDLTKYKRVVTNKGVYEPPKLKCK